MAAARIRTTARSPGRWCTIALTILAMTALENRDLLAQDAPRRVSPPRSATRGLPTEPDVRSSPRDGGSSRAVAPELLRNYDDRDDVAVPSAAAPAPRIMRDYDASEPLVAPTNARRAPTIDTTMQNDPVVVVLADPSLPPIRVRLVRPQRTQQSMPRQLPTIRARGRYSRSRFITAALVRIVHVYASSPRTINRRDFVAAFGSEISVESRLAPRVWAGALFSVSPWVSPFGGGAELRAGGILRHDLVRRGAVIPSTFIVVSFSFLATRYLAFALELSAGAAIDFRLTRRLSVFLQAAVGTALTGGIFGAHDGEPRVYDEHLIGPFLISTSLGLRVGF